jgi:hypothetical protein
MQTAGRERPEQLALFGTGCVCNIFGGCARGKADLGTRVRATSLDTRRQTSMQEHGLKAKSNESSTMCAPSLSRPDESLFSDRARSVNNAKMTFGKRLRFVVKYFFLAHN